MEFDHKILETLPTPTKDDMRRVLQIIRAIIGRRVIPYFKMNRGTEATLIARVNEHLRVERLEDEDGLVRAVTLFSERDGEHTIYFHERIFDYLAFVIPSDPDSGLGEGGAEERKMLAFAEFALRHQLEHLLYPRETEREVIRSDVEFAIEQRDQDPTYYRSLRNALADEMNGILGGPILGLLDLAEQDQSYDKPISGILARLADMLGDMPEEALLSVFPSLDADLKIRVLSVCYQKGRETAYSLRRRTDFLEKLLWLFVRLFDGEETEARSVFDTFKDRWGLVYLFRELEIPESRLEGKDPQEALEIFKEGLKHFSEGEARISHFPYVREAQPLADLTPSAPPKKSLKERIEEARNDPSIPLQAKELMEKNKLHAVGHSGPKYSELIETLLAIPWGMIQKIGVSAEAFEEGLNHSHYGLEKPKEIICDFFSNLIWRYRQRHGEDSALVGKTGSAFLFVGPPGVGKTSLAISIAKNLGIPYHKMSLGGMRDEADLRGYGFTYEGSKPGAIVQGLIKMGVMNGIFIMDEADKTEKFAIATLLEILDPEQNHLFHDKFTQSTVDVDLSNCHFILTANTLETVPPPVINRCEVVQLDRYSVEEKVAIAREHLTRRVRQRYGFTDQQIFFDPEKESGLLRYLVRTYTHEAGVRELERIIRTLFLRIGRKEVLAHERDSVKITRALIKKYLEPPRPFRLINDEDRVGEAMGLGVNVEMGLGSLIPIQTTMIPRGGEGEGRSGYLSMVHATGNIQKIMDESRKVAGTAILHWARELEIDLKKAEAPVHIHFMGASTPKDGPSAGIAIALALASVLSGSRIRRDVAMTGEIDTQGRVNLVGGLDLKLETAYDAGCKTMLIPKENLVGEGSIEKLSDALREELQVLSYDQWKQEHEPFDRERHVLQVVAVDHILQAADVAFIRKEELKALESCFRAHADSLAAPLTRVRKKPERCIRLLLVKDIGELDLEGFGTSLWEESGYVFLVGPDAKETVRMRFPDFEKQGRLRDFDPAGQRLASIFPSIVGAFKHGASEPVSLVLQAPYFFLCSDDVSKPGFDPGPEFSGMTLLANNYTDGGLKIKACKPVLNRAYAHLTRLAPQYLEACPFLRKRDHIHVADLSFIPEKYRLDSKRAEAILTACLRDWLAAVENPQKQKKTRNPKGGKQTYQASEPAL